MQGSSELKPLLLSEPSTPPARWGCRSSPASSWSADKSLEPVSSDKNDKSLEPVSPDKNQPKALSKSASHVQLPKLPSLNENACQSRDGAYLPFPRSFRSEISLDSLVEANSDHRFSTSTVENSMNSPPTSPKTPYLSDMSPFQFSHTRCGTDGMDASNFLVISGLGQGGYASVVLCRQISTHKLFAMKAIPKDRVSKSRDRSRLVRELAAMRDIPSSPFLQRCHSAFESRVSLFFVCDYNPGGDLFFHLNARKINGKSGFTEVEARTLLAEVVLGIEHMHSNSYIHR